MSQPLADKDKLGIWVLPESANVSIYLGKIAEMMMHLRSVFILLFVVSFRASFCLAQDFEVVKDRVVAELMQEDVADDRVESILNRRNTDGSFADIDYSDLSRTAGFPHRKHTSDLVYLARAYQNGKSPYYHRKELKEAIIKSLEFWVDHDFFGDNWHNNQISTPTNLVSLMLLIGDELPEDLVARAQPMIGRAHMHASGARPSGDRIVIASILAKNLLFIGDEQHFAEIIKLIENEVKFSTGSRGIQHDYSFHHRVDRVNNTTSYGYGKYANAFGEWSYYVADTKYAFSVEKINRLVDYYLDGICKQLVYGIYEDISVKNRSISNQAEFRPKSIVEVEKLLFSTDYRKEELEEIIRLRKGESKPSQSFAKFFWQTEHFVFQRPNFYTTVRMYSTRNRNMEEPYNGPGKTTHHRADGTNYLQLKGDEYHNIWPVYDWQKISGTTILQKRELHDIDNIQMDGVTDFVGAVTDGMYGAVAFDFRSPHDMVKAKKSWFFFDDEYVCLGTDIRAKSNLPIATTINQVLMRGEVKIRQDDQFNLLPKGTHKIHNAKAIYHNRVGYILPVSADINVSNQVQQGRWSDITDQKNISTELISLDVFTLWYDHGSRPDSASYEYIVVPDISEQELGQTCDRDQEIEILSNTAKIQAVKHITLGLCQMAFYEAGGLQISPELNVTMASQGMVMLKLHDGQVTELTVADPSRKLSKMMLTISGIYAQQGDSFSTIPDPGKGNTLFIIDLPEGVYSGKSETLSLR